MHNDRLQRIIELKEHLMEEKERELDEQSRERDRIITHIEMLNGEIESNFSDLCSRCLEGSEFVSIRDYLEHLGRAKTDALNRKTAVEKQMAIIRQALVEMLKEIKVLDGLQQKRISAARRAENKKHQKLLDEIALRIETRKI